MTTILKASPRSFVSTPAIERVATRALRYLQSGYSIHLRGPAGTGKTTLALHLADLLARPIMLLFGDDEFKTSDLIGNQSGYTRKKVVDNFIHSVVKVEDELRQNWVDSRLTLACREGFTMVYDEFNRSRPEVNNVLLSALEEKLLVLPPSNNRPEYIRVHPHFRAIFTSNPEEYVGVHDTQDALLDRLITINIPESDELSQQEIVVHKAEIDRESAQIIVRIVRSFREKVESEKSSGLRSCLILAKVCHEHGIVATPENAEFRDICQDILISRSGLPLNQATQLLWEVFNEQILAGIGGGSIAQPISTITISTIEREEATEVEPNPPKFVDAAPVEWSAALEEATPKAMRLDQATDLDLGMTEIDLTLPPVGAHEVDVIDLYAQTETEEMEGAGAGAILYETAEAIATSSESEAPLNFPTLPYTPEVYQYLQENPAARASEVESALGISRFHAVNAIQALTQKGLVANRNGSSKPHRTRRGR